VRGEGSGSTEQLRCGLCHHVCDQSQRYKKWKSRPTSRPHRSKLRERTAVFTPTLSSVHSFCTAGPARPRPLALSEPRSPDESRPDAASRLLSPVLIHLRWLPEECPFLRSTVAVPATWDCVCRNALPEMIMTVNYEQDHGSNSNFTINITVPLCDAINPNTQLLGDNL